MQCRAQIDSIYHGSCVDGQGIRSVIFFSGCNLRCPFCHNPETLYVKGKTWELEDLLKVLLRYKNYYKNGGVTLSGGEPFLQAEFLINLIDALKKEGVSVIAETNGKIVDFEVIKRLDGVRLDVKNQNNEDYKTLLERYKPFIETCQKYSIPITITNVVCPTVNDSNYSLENLVEFVKELSLENNVELLPFKKMCKEKYDKLGMEFPFNTIPEADEITINFAKNILRKHQ